jgi:hypothetical protein
VAYDGYIVDTKGWITVLDAFRALRLEPSPEVTWPVGDRVREKWLTLHGELPRKALRSKTYDRGSHCFAVYPPGRLSLICDEIKAVAADAARQGELDL